MDQQNMPVMDQTAKGHRKQQAFDMAKAFAIGLAARIPPGDAIDADALTDAVVQLTKMQLDKLRKAKII